MVNASQRFDGHTFLFNDFVEGLATQGVQPRVYTCIDPSSASKYALEGERLLGRHLPLGETLEMGYNRLLPVFARQIGRLPGDLVHVNDAHLARAAQYRNNVVVTLADLGKLTTRYYPRIPSWIHNRCLTYAPRCQGIVCCTSFVRGEILRTLPVQPDRVRVVPNHSMIPPSPGPREPPPPPTEKEPWVLLYVATDRPHKNTATFVRVVHAMGSRFQGHLISRLAPRTWKLIDELGIRSRLRVESEVPDIIAAYRSAQVMLFPSLFEGFGRPLVEAMGQALPVLGANRTCVPEVVGSGGTVLEPDDLAGWVHAVEALVPPEDYRRASTRAWERGRQFSPQRTGEALVSAYRALRELGPVKTPG